ncbi:hypothetical protein AVEN_74910-1, partial [Araneus ventricosus]
SEKNEIPCADGSQFVC